MALNITYEKSALASFLDDLPKMMLQYQMASADRMMQDARIIASNQRSDKRDEVNRLAAELNKIENERNWYVGEVTKTQNSINAITEATTSIQDIYKTSSVPSITADVTDEPIKYYKEKIAEASAQMNILKPYYGKATGELGGISRVLDFLQKGVGVSPGEDKIYGPEDFLPEIYSPDKKLSESEQAVFEKYPVSQSLIDQLSAAQYEAEKSRLGIQEASKYRKSVSLYNEYSPEIRDASMYFLPINIKVEEYNTELDAGDKEELGKELNLMYLREGAGFFPETAFTLDISYNSTKEELETVFDEVEKLVSSGQQLSLEQSQKVEAWEKLRDRGQQLRNVNIPRYSDTNVKRGVVTVQPYLERDRFLAEAYYGYKQMEGVDKENYRIYIDHVLGVDFHNRATVRNRLERYFMDDLIHEYTGGISYDNLSESDQEWFKQRALEIKHTLGFDIGTGKFGSYKDKEWVIDE